MAIIIPSRNIYEKTLDKIKDNTFDNVEVEGNEVVPDNHYEEVVYNEKIETLKNIDDEIQIKRELVPESIGYVGEPLYRNKFRYIDLNSAHIINYKFQVPKTRDNSYISSIFIGKNLENKPNIKLSVYYKYFEYPLSGSVSYTIGSGGQSATINSVAFERSGEDTVSESRVGDIPTNFDYTFEYPSGWGSSVTMGLSVVDKSTITSDKVYTEDNDFFYFDLSFLTKATFRHLSHFIMTAKTGDFIETISGMAKHYEPYRAEITLYGNTIGIDLESKTVTIGSGNKPTSLGSSDNELLQTSNYIQKQDSEIMSNAIETDYGNTLKQYQNGKETATLLCSISDYYDEDGNKVIAIDSTNKMCFRMYDEVIPYTFGANGQDKPLSKNKDGSPKQFQVLGVKPIYDGAVWQELTLQEV